MVLTMTPESSATAPCRGERLPAPTRRPTAALSLALGTLDTSGDWRGLVAGQPAFAGFALHVYERFRPFPERRD